MAYHITSKFYSIIILHTQTYLPSFGVIYEITLVLSSKTKKNRRKFEASTTSKRLQWLIKFTNWILITVISAYIPNVIFLTNHSAICMWNEKNRWNGECHSFEMRQYCFYMYTHLYYKLQLFKIYRLGLIGRKLTKTEAAAILKRINWLCKI